MNAYQDLLRDPRWQEKHLKILARDGYVCQQCDQHAPLDIHHHYYTGSDPWDYDDSVLISLCRPHHKQEEINKHLDIPSIHYLLELGCTRQQHIDLITDLSKAARKTHTPAKTILRQITAYLNSL
jgi:hypothetical protein